VNESSHQVLTIKAIHYSPMPRDCVCKILLGVKDGEGEKKTTQTPNQGQTILRKHTNDLSLDSSTLRLQLSYSFTALSQKLARASFAKGVFNCNDESRAEKKKKR